MIPKDPVMLLSFVNLKLRDFYSSLDDMCREMELDRKELEKKLEALTMSMTRDVISLYRFQENEENGIFM